MRYLSPASLPDGPAINPPDQRALMLQRRKLLAELELSSDGMLHIKDRSLSKNDILEYFETLQDETILHYHSEVSKDKILVEFLEEGRLQGEALFSEAGLYEELPFLEWISAYFYTAFTEYVTKCLQEPNEDELHALLQNRLLLTQYDRERAWIQIKQLLENDISRLQHFRGQADQADQADAASSIEGISSLATESYIRMIFLFPQVPFAGVRDKYAIALMEISIYVFNKHKDNRDTAQAWMRNAKQLAVSAEVVNAIDEKIHQMEKMRNKTDAVLKRVAVIIGIILIKFFVFQGSGSGSSNNIPQFTKFNYINGKDTINIHDFKQLDSVMHNRLLPDSAHHLMPR